MTLTLTILVWQGERTSAESGGLFLYLEKSTNCVMAFFPPSPVDTIDWINLKDVEVGEGFQCLH